MIRMKIAVLIEDEEILNRFVNSLSMKLNEELEIYAYSNADKAMGALVSDNINMFLVHSDIKIEKKSIPKMCTLIYLSETKDIAEIEGVKCVCLYQRPEMIYSILLGVYAENSTESIRNAGASENKSNVYTFMSPVGGVGTSTIAAAFAIYLANKSRKVLYVNMEKNGDAGAFFYGDGSSDFGEIMYDIKSKKTNLSVRIESKVRLDNTGVYFIESSRNALDMIYMSAKDIAEFVEAVSEARIFSDIIIDTDCDMSDKTTTLFKLSNNTIIVNDGKDVSNAKMARFSAAVSAFEIENGESYNPKMCLFLNRFNSKRDSYNENLKWNLLGGMDDYYGESSRQIIQRIIRSNIFDYYFYGKK